MSRFERKIMVAIFFVAIGPLISSLIFMRSVVEDTYRTGITAEFSSGLKQGVEARRAHLYALRESSERTADAVASEVERTVGTVNNEAVEKAFAPLLERYSDVSTITLRRGDEVIGSLNRKATSDEALRSSERERTVILGGQELQLGVEVTAPEEAFTRLERAGEIADAYSRLEREEVFVSRVEFWWYAGSATVVILLTLIIGVVLSRRVTRRVAALARATHRVGAGDLTVTVPTGANDEVTELTQAFNQMVRDLRESRMRIEYLQRIGAWQDFARRLAHEIKNPLTPIQLAAQEMDHSYGGEDPVYRDKLTRARAIIEEEVATLRRLVGEFSSFAKLPRADLVPASLREFILSLEDSFPAILEDLSDGSVDIEVRCATDPMPVRIDPMMLKRCVDNLVRNAVQALQKSEIDGRGHVLVAAFQERGTAVIEVRDNGSGVPRANWDRIFDPYYTTKSEGTGLGLAIVKKVVLEHGGEIQLSQAPEGGAQFRIELPMGPA